MPIYEFACPKCRRIFNFLSRRIEPDRLPVCPKCGHKNLAKQVSTFAALKTAGEPATAHPSEPGRPDVEDPRMMRAMAEMERDLARMDENNPKHMAQMLRKMKNLLPAGSTPKEFEVAIQRLESGEDPEKIEADMGDVLGGFLGDDEPAGGAGGGGYSRDSGLYDF